MRIEEYVFKMMECMILNTLILINNSRNLMIGQQKEHRFRRQSSKYIKKQSGNNSMDSLSSFQEQEHRQVSLVLNEAVTNQTIIEQQPNKYNSTILDALRKWATVNAHDFKVLLLDRKIRQETIREEKRLNQIANDRQQKTTHNCELYLAALNNVLNLSEDAFRDITELKSNSTTENKVRKNQIKEMSRQLQFIEEQIRQYNFISVRFTIQDLLNRFDKDEYLQQKIKYLKYIQWLTEEYQKQKNILNEINGYINQLSKISPSIQSLQFSIEHLKKLKQELKIAVKRQNHKQEANQRILTVISQILKIQGTLRIYLEAHNSQIKESVPEQQNDNKNRRDIRQYRSNSKRLDAQQEQRKLSVDKKGKSITKLQDYAVNIKRQLAEVNMCLKSIAIVYQKRNVFSESLNVELSKCYQRYQNNYLIFNIRGNLEKIIHSVQQKDRSAKQGFYQNEAKKMRKENQRLHKLVQQTKRQLIKNSSQQFTKKEVVFKQQTKSMQISDFQKEEKDIDKQVSEINSSISSKMWIETKKLIAVFNQKYKESTNSITNRCIKNIGVILTMVEYCEQFQDQIIKRQRRMKQIQTELSYSQQRRQVQRSLVDSLKFQGEKIKIQHAKAINELSSQIETLSKNYNQLQNRYACDIKYYIDLNTTLTSACVNMQDSQKGRYDSVPSIALQKREDWQQNNEQIINIILSQKQRILQEQRAQDKAQYQQLLQFEKDKSKQYFEQQKSYWILQRQIQQKQWKGALQLLKQQFQQYKKRSGLRENVSTSQQQYEWRDRQLFLEQQIKLYEDKLSQLQIQLNQNITIISKYQYEISQHKNQLDTSLIFIQASQKQKTDYVIQIQKLKDQIIMIQVSGQEQKKIQTKEVEKITSQQRQCLNSQIMHLRAQLKEALDRQTQTKDNQCLAGYIQVLRDIKKNARAFKQTGSSQHIDVIYTCLGIN